MPDPLHDPFLFGLWAVAWLLQIVGSLVVAAVILVVAFMVVNEAAALFSDLAGRARARLRARRDTRHAHQYPTGNRLS